MTSHESKIGTAVRAPLCLRAEAGTAECWAASGLLLRSELEILLLAMLCHIDIPPCSQATPEDGVLWRSKANPASNCNKKGWFLWLLYAKLAAVSC